MKDPRDMRHVDGSVTINKTQLMFQIAQLRHGYNFLINSEVRNQAQFADNLLSPVIKSLERMIE